MKRRFFALIAVSAFLIAFSGLNVSVHAAPVVNIINFTLNCNFTYTATDAAGVVYGPFFTVPGQVDTFVMPPGVAFAGITIGGIFFPTPAPAGACVALPFGCPTLFCDLGGCTYGFF